MMEDLIIANWKLNLDANSARWWVDSFSEKFVPDKRYIVSVAPSFTEIPIVLDRLEERGLEDKVMVYAQNVSSFEKGRYTGEVSAVQLMEHGVTGVIIGHSERRKYFNENDEVVVDKVKMAIAYGLTPVVCVSNMQQVEALTNIENKPRIIIAYEPIEAIGSGRPDSPEHINKMLAEIKSMMGEGAYTLYGGSVNSGNVASFIKLDVINGFLIGTASIRPGEFVDILDRIREV